MAAIEQKTYEELINLKGRERLSSNLQVRVDGRFILFEHDASHSLPMEKYKVHVNIDIKDIDKAFDVLYPLLTADDTPVLISKSLMLNKLEWQEKLYTDSLATAQRGIRNEPNARIVHESDKETALRRLKHCERMRAGCQFTFYLHGLEQNSLRYIEFLDKVETALVSAKVRPAKNCPLGDIPLVTYLISGRYEYDEKGAYVDAIQENPYSKEMSEISPFFQGIINYFQNKYLAAATGGNIDAMYQLALMYSCNSNHIDTAEMWYKRAADSGHVGALQVLLIPQLLDYLKQKETNTAAFLRITLSDHKTKKNERNAVLTLIDKLNDSNNEKRFSEMEVKILLSDERERIIEQFPWLVQQLMGEWAALHAQNAPAPRMGSSSR